MRNPFFTIGHSTRPIATFVELLKEANVGLLVDVRTVPRSRTNPQYNTDVLPRSLMEWQIGYEHIAALGGLRGRISDVPPQVNAFWQNQSFHNYADYALTEEFRAGLAQLRVLGHERRSAIMCAEASPYRCHRRLISDFAELHGIEVVHLLDARRAERHHVTAFARRAGDGVVYETGPQLTLPGGGG